MNNESTTNRIVNLQYVGGACTVDMEDYNMLLRTALVMASSKEQD